MDTTSSLPEPHTLGALLRSVVKVLTVSDAPDYEQPWQTVGPSSSSGSGVIVQTARGPRVLTNGHCVEDHVFVEVCRYGHARKFVAELEAAGHQCDLALLRVDDPRFFEGVVPVRLGPLPQLSDQVSVCGYPIGGERLSISQGIVSRIDLVRYTQSQRQLLGIQIDAAINEGNSGGPVLRDGRLVGIAFQALEEAQQIGYVIPTPVVEHFLRDVDNGLEDGFPDLGVVVQPLESPAHRRSLGLASDGEHGVLINHVVYGGSAWGVLEQGDVLLGVDGVPIAADGTVPLREGERLDFSYVVSRRHVDETMNLKVWRDETELDCVVVLRTPQYLVVEDRHDVRPSYYIFGGLLFVPLTRDYLQTWDDPWWQNAPEDLMALYERGIRTAERQEPVVLQKVFADRTNQGYHELESQLVAAVQGQPVRSMRHMVQLIESSADDFVRLELGDGRRVVIDRCEAAERHEAILSRYGVLDDRSEDLKDIRPRPSLAQRRPHPRRLRAKRLRGRDRRRPRGEGEHSKPRMPRPSRGA